MLGIKNLTQAVVQIEQAQRIQRTMQRVVSSNGLYIHLPICIVMIAWLLLLDPSDGGNHWLLWLMLGWGISFYGHLALVMGLSEA